MKKELMDKWIKYVKVSEIHRQTRKKFKVANGLVERIKKDAWRAEVRAQAMARDFDSRYAENVAGVKAERMITRVEQDVCRKRGWVLHGKAKKIKSAFDYAIYRVWLKEVQARMDWVKAVVKAHGDVVFNWTQRGCWVDGKDFYPYKASK